MIAFTVNGKSHETDTPPDRPLLEVLREDLRLHGAHYGCGEGQCRACTVLIDGKPTVSCLTPVGEVANKKVTTIEGLANDDKLHPVQQAFLDRDAFQCGYCTCGMILSLVGTLNETRDESEIMQRMNRNLCRCCGYDVIADAIKAATAAVKGGAK